MKIPLYLILTLFSLLNIEANTGSLLGNPDRASISSRSVGYGVNATTGNFYYSTVDASMPGTEIPFVFGRSYNSLATTTDTFGNTLPAPFGTHRWTHSYNLVLTFHAANDQAEIYWGDGHRDGFIKVGNVWQPSTPGNFNHLEKVGGTTWTITTRNRVRFEFTNTAPIARLTKIVSRSGHEMTFSYNASNELASLTDTHGRVITFAYATNKLQTVSLPVTDGRSFSFTYSGIGDLSSLVDMRSKPWSYTYTNGKLVRIYEGGANPSTTAGVIMQNSYKTDRRIETQKPGFLISSPTKKYDFTWDDGSLSLNYFTPEGAAYQFKRDSSNRLRETKQLSIVGSPTYTINYKLGSGISPETVRIEKINDYRSKETNFENYEGLFPKLVTYADSRTVITSLLNTDFYDPSVVTSATKGKAKYENYHSTYYKPQRVIIEQPATVQAFSPTIQYNLTYFGGSQAGLVQMRENNDSTNGFEQVVYSYKTGTSLPETVTYFLDPTNPAKKIIFTYAYDTTGRLVSKTDYRGTKTYFYYDNNNNVTDVISGGTWANAPPNTTVASSSIAHVRYVYDAANRRTQTIHHYGSLKERVMKYEYSNIHLQLVRTYDHNNTREFKVANFTDELRPFRVQNPNRSREDQFHQSLDKTRSVEFINAKHNPAYDGNSDYQYIRRKQFDSQGNLLSLGYASGVTDKADPLADVNANQVLLQMGYDEINRVTSMTMTLEANGTNPTVTRNIGYAYADEGRKITIDYEQDTLGSKKIYEFDANGGLYRVTEQDNAKSVVARTYRDPAGRVKKVVDPSNFETTYTYNGIGDLLTKTEAHFGQSSWTYDYANGVVVETLPSGYKFRRTYNRLNQLTKVESTQNNFSSILNTFLFAYDEAGNLSQETWSGIGGNDSRSYTWNVYGELVGVTDPSGLNITYVRDEQTGDLKNIQFAGYDLGYAYNVFGQQKSLTVKKDGSTLGQYIFGYENVYGSLNHCQFPNGYHTNHIYNAQNELTQKQTGLTGQPKILDYTLERNGRGLRSKIQVNAQPLTPKLFDLNLSLTRSNTTDLLEQIGGHTVTHDGNKNLTQVSGLNIGPFSFDEFNRYTSQGTTVSHQYDAGTNRTSSTRSGVTTKYLTDMSGALPNIIATLDGSNVPTEVFLYGPGGLIGSVKNGQIRGVHCDTNANVVALSDPTTALIRQYMYSPFGDIVNREGAKDFPFRFAGGVGVFSDPEGTVSMRARVYHPRLRQFLSPDPFPGFFARPQSLQKYAYVEGQVLAKNDPSGFYAEEYGFKYHMGLLADSFHEAVTDASFGLTRSLAGAISPQAQQWIDEGGQRSGVDTNSFNYKYSEFAGVVINEAGLPKVGKVSKVLRSSKVQRGQTTIIGENMRDRVVPFANKTGSRTIPFGTTRSEWAKLTPHQRWKLNDGALRKRIKEGDSFQFIGIDKERPPAERLRFDLTGSELLRLKDRKIPYQTVAPSKVKSIIGRP